MASAGAPRAATARPRTAERVWSESCMIAECWLLGVGWIGVYGV